MGESFENKFPKASQKTSACFAYVKEVWQETFPDEKGAVKTKMDERRERARVAKEHQEKMKNMSQEELDAYMESIPEWKRGALVVSQTEEQQAEELKGFFGKAKDRLKNRINKSETV